MQPKTNYHSHCDFCDGKGPIESFIQSAIEQGFTNYGVSTHSPLPFDAPWVIRWDRVEEYIRTLRTLQIQYADKIELSAGMEIDYLNHDYNPANEYFQGLDLDYRIGSVHFVPSERDMSPVDVDCGIHDFTRSINYHFQGSVERLVKGYYKAKQAMIERGGFDFIGHADKVSMNASELSSKIMDKSWYKDLVEEFLLTCAQKEIRLEINTKAWEIKGLFFPDERYFRRISELGIAVVVNSDAHRTERISSGLEQATEKLRKAGVERIEKFSNGMWSQL